MAILTTNTGVAVGAKPSVLDVVLLQGATVTPFLSMIGKGSVTNILHSWITDKVRDARDNAQIEVSASHDLPEGTKQKTSNVTQIFTNYVEVSFSEQGVATYGQSELAHQLNKCAKEHALDIERALLGLNNKTVFDAYTERQANAVAAKLAGIFHYVPDAHRFNKQTAGAGGNTKAVKLDLAALNDILIPVWQNNNSLLELNVFCSALLKRKINEIAKDYLVHENKDNQVNYTITKIYTDFGVVNFIPHRMFNAQNKLEKTLLAFDKSLISFKTLANTGSTNQTKMPSTTTADVYRTYTEGTLEVKDNYALASAENVE